MPALGSTASTVLKGEDAPALPEKAEPPDDDLVGMVSVQAVAHVLELAERASLARDDVVLVWWIPAIIRERYGSICTP